MTRILRTSNGVSLSRCIGFFWGLHMVLGSMCTLSTVNDIFPDFSTHKLLRNRRGHTTRVAVNLTDTTRENSGGAGSTYSLAEDPNSCLWRIDFMQPVARTSADACSARPRRPQVHMLLRSVVCCCICPAGCGKVGWWWRWSAGRSCSVKEGRKGTKGKWVRERESVESVYNQPGYPLSGTWDGDSGWGEKLFK